MLESIAASLVVGLLVELRITVGKIGGRMDAIEGKCRDCKPSPVARIGVALLVSSVFFAFTR